MRTQWEKIYAFWPLFMVFYHYLCYLTLLYADVNPDTPAKFNECILCYSEAYNLFLSCGCLLLVFKKTGRIFVSFFKRNIKCTPVSVACGGNYFFHPFSFFKKMKRFIHPNPVSYTHLTLPTIYSV